MPQPQLSVFTALQHLHDTDILRYRSLDEFSTRLSRKDNALKVLKMQLYRKAGLIRHEYLIFTIAKDKLATCEYYLRIDCTTQPVQFPLPAVSFVSSILNCNPRDAVRLTRQIDGNAHFNDSNAVLLADAIFLPSFGFRVKYLIRILEYVNDQASEWEHTLFWSNSRCCARTIFLALSRQQWPKEAYIRDALLGEVLSPTSLDSFSANLVRHDTNAFIILSFVYIMAVTGVLNVTCGLFPSSPFLSGLGALRTFALIVITLAAIYVGLIAIEGQLLVLYTTHKYEVRLCGMLELTLMWDRTLLFSSLPANKKKSQARRRRPSPILSLEDFAKMHPINFGAPMHQSSQSSVST